MGNEELSNKEMSNLRNLLEKKYPCEFVKFVFV